MLFVDNRKNLYNVMNFLEYINNTYLKILLFVLTERKGGDTNQWSIET